MPRRHRTESKTSPRRIMAVKRAAQALELRLGGASFDQIAEALGYRDKSGAYRACMAALNRIPYPEVVATRQVNLERLNRIRLLNQANLRKADSKAMSMEISIQEREARYLGLDAPVTQRHTGEGGGPIILRVVYDEPETLKGEQ